MRTLFGGTAARLVRIAIWSGVVMVGMEITHEAFYETEAGAATFVACYAAFGLCVVWDLAQRSARAAESFVRRFWTDEARHARDYAGSLRVSVLLFGGGYAALLLRFSREAGFVPEFEHFSVQMGALLLGLGAGALLLVRQILVHRPAPVVGADDTPAPTPRGERW